ncbi:retinol dehydrogenase 7-like isoform X1 [Myxocyprinus asiaticus]|uniref:retinol dehydrogenase 7-like isoform X1 n=1 Tax=Myxocyprinus asiaticus TaxID=70543 RepID=UPI002221D034|nr:retinol dehydrogenase 7-like isoform X1 [Myxocyprinus asiaticus]
MLHELPALISPALLFLKPTWRSTKKQLFTKHLRKVSHGGRNDVRVLKKRFHTVIRLGSICAAVGSYLVLPGQSGGCLTEKGADDLKRATGPFLKTCILDVSSTASIEKAVEWTKKEVGDKGLWGLVNNAGRSLPMGPSEWMKIEDFQSTLKVNMIGVIEITMNFLPLVKKARGRVVNVASVLGRVAANGGGYCISKFGVESFSDCLRRDIQYFGVNVCIIEPGFFKTQVTSLEPIERELHRLWNQLTPEVKESYGDKYLDKYIKIQRLIMNAICDSDLSKVTNCMEHALLAVHPRTRYSAGWDAKLLWIPLSYMPACFVDIALKLVMPKPAKGV